MSCTEITTRSALLTHLTQHVRLACPKCQGQLAPDDGTIVFGNAQMITTRCVACNEEKIFLCNQDGSILEMNEELSAVTPDPS